MANYLYTIQNANLKNTGINRQPNIYFGIENGGPALFDIKDAYVNYSEDSNNPLKNDQITGELHQVVTVNTTTNRIGLTTAETIVKSGLNADNLDILTRLANGESVITSAHHKINLQTDINLINTDINTSDIDINFYAVKIDDAGHIVKASTPYSIEALAEALSYALSSKLAVYFEAKHGTATISSESIKRQKTNIIDHISWSGYSWADGSTTNKTINSGSNAELNIGTVTAYYKLNGTATIRTSGIKGTLTIESSNIEVIPKPDDGDIIKNGDTTIKGIKEGSAKITVKDDDTTIKEFYVTVNNEDNSEDVTNSATFSVFSSLLDSGSIDIINSETIRVNAPEEVDSDTQVTIICTYTNNSTSTQYTATQKVRYTAKAISTTNYKWYVGHITNDQFESSLSLNTIVTSSETSTTSTTGPSTLTMPTTTGDVLVYIYPTVWGTPTIVDSIGYGTGDMSYEDVLLTPPSGYKVRFWDPGHIEGETLSITWVK